MTFHPSILPPHSSPGHVENSQVGINSPKRSSTKVLLNTEGLPTIPSRNSFLHTSIYTTDLVEMNVAESTMQTSKVIPNGHHGNSQIGMHTHVTYQNNHNTLNDNRDNSTHNNIQKEEP